MKRLLKGLYNMQNLASKTCLILLMGVLLSNCAPESLETNTGNPSTNNALSFDMSKPVPNTIEDPTPSNVTNLTQGPEGSYQNRSVTFLLRRNKAGDWRFLTEGKHVKSPDVLAVETYHDHVAVTYKRLFTQIYGFSCSVDRSLAMEDITCGISGAVRVINIFFKKIGVPGPLDPTLVPDDDTNISITVEGYDDLYEGASQEVTK